MEAKETNEGFIYNLDYSKPVDLQDLSKSFDAIADEYRRFLAASGKKYDDSIRLHVRQIKQGSILADIGPYVAMGLPFLEHLNTIIDFTKHIKDGFDFFLGSKPAPEKDIDITTRENLRDMLAPVAPDPKAVLLIQNITNNGTMTVVNVSNADAGIIRNSITKSLEATRKPSSGIHEKVLLTWFQARNDPKAKTGDKAIIESINSRAVKALFVTEATKSKLLSSSENPFTKGYIVDVSVETVRGKPKVYRIIDVHETVDLEESAQIELPKSGNQLLTEQSPNSDTPDKP